MPAHYAHFVFGLKVTRKLPDQAKALIGSSRETLDSYFLGFQGPDPLAFYKPWRPGEINHEGEILHARSGRFFFSRALVYEKEEPCEARRAYLLGFMCHYMLDSSCHPLVTKYMKEEGITHSLVEREFDSMLIRKDGKDPVGLNLDMIIPDEPSMGEIISPFYHSAGAEKIQESIVSMKRILELMSSPDPKFRKRSYKMMTMIPPARSHADMIAKEKASPFTRESNAALLQRLEETVDPCVTEIERLMESMEEDKHLSKRINLNFMGRTV